MTGLYREHPVGAFVLPALFGRVVGSPEQAAYIVGALYQVLTILLIPRLAATFVEVRHARPLGWLLQLLPIAFTYRIRANQESALLVCFLAALYGLERARTRPVWGALTVAALGALTLVKGVLAIPCFLLCAVWLLVGRGPDRGSARPAWIALLIALVATLGGTVVYEALYRAVTGESFLATYLGRQLGAAAAAQSEALFAQKAYNLVWYLGRVVWFPFPWSLVAMAVVGRSVVNWRAGRSEPAPALLDTPDRRARRGFVFATAVVLLYVILFSVSDRRADRYIFPVYYAAGAAGALVALRQWPRLSRAVERIDRFHPYVTVGVWAATFALHLLAGHFHVPRIKIWAPDA
jgi:4-amino-4-deoxy-L-arabinose transferase-like glycosyltransferase